RVAARPAGPARASRLWRSLAALLRLARRGSGGRARGGLVTPLRSAAALVRFVGRRGGPEGSPRGGADPPRRGADAHRHQAGGGAQGEDPDQRGARQPLAQPPAAHLGDGRQDAVPATIGLRLGDFFSPGLTALASAPEVAVIFVLV